MLSIFQVESLLDVTVDVNDVPALATELVRDLLWVCLAAVFRISRPASVEPQNGTLSGYC